MNIFQTQDDAQTGKAIAEKLRALPFAQRERITKDFQALRNNGETKYNAFRAVLQLESVCGNLPRDLTVLVERYFGDLLPSVRRVRD